MLFFQKMGEMETNLIFRGLGKFQNVHKVVKNLLEVFISSFKSHNSSCPTKKQKIAYNKTNSTSYAKTFGQAGIECSRSLPFSLSFSFSSLSSTERNWLLQKPRHIMAV